jgi:hypothetical protein
MEGISAALESIHAEVAIRATLLPIVSTPNSSASSISPAKGFIKANRRGRG